MRVLFNIERLINPSAEEKAALEKVLHSRTLKKNEHFLKEGDPCTSIAFIEKAPSVRTINLKIGTYARILRLKMA